MKIYVFFQAILSGIDGIESGRRNFMYGPAGPDLAKNLRHIFHLEMRAKSFLDIK